MSEIEFEIIDELYFVESFASLQKKISLEEHLLKKNLAELLKKGWIKNLIEPDKEAPFQLSDFEKYYSTYYYLATKQGLLVHNTR